MQTITVKPQDYHLDKDAIITNQDGSDFTLSTNPEQDYEIHTDGLMYYLVFYAIHKNMNFTNYKVLANNSFYLSKIYINLLLVALYIERYFRGSDTQSKVVFILQSKTKHPNQAVQINNWINALQYIKAHPTKALNVTYINH